MHSFIGRSYESALLQTEFEKPLASLVVAYGRRRVGKTRLLTEFYRDKKLWRFDGVEKGAKDVQIKNFLNQLADYTGQNVYRTMVCHEWIEVFKLLDRAIRDCSRGYRRTILLDEFPYLANYQQDCVAAVKWAWDNLWQEQKNFTLVLCGSVASFMVKKVLQSSALYGRVTLEMCLRPLSLGEARSFFGGRKSSREVCDLYLMCGGIPEYLQRFSPKESAIKEMARLAFMKDGYFVGEFNRIFKDIFNEEKIYKKIISLLSRYKSLKGPEMADLLDVSGGGGLVDILNNLEWAGFIKTQTPWERPNETKLKRYYLSDEYTLFYFRFIQPHLKRICENKNFQTAIDFFKSPSYKIWAGFAFERVCLKHVDRIMDILGIVPLVRNHGAYFNRASNTKEGVQIDLMFDRHDPVVTICEMKYYQGLVGPEIIEQVERKVRLLDETKKTVEKVLVTTEGVTDKLKEKNYFSRIILLEELC